MGVSVITGDETADGLLRLILARAAATPRGVCEDIHDGIQSIFFTWAGMARQLNRTIGEICLAITRLEADGYLRLERGVYQHGLHVFLRTRARSAA